MFQKGKEKFLSEARTLARFNRQEGVVSVTDFFETNNTAYIVMEFLDGITLKQYTVNELVDMAKRFARKRQYEVDDDALLELYLKIDKLHSVNDNIKLDDIKEIINRAIANSEKRASRKFFGGLKKKRSERGDVIFLTEADFKD